MSVGTMDKLYAHELINKPKLALEVAKEGKPQLGERYLGGFLRGSEVEVVYKLFIVHIHKHLNSSYS